jgi:glycosyltransferase involved in cell wall biosynthesis
MSRLRIVVDARPLSHPQVGGFRTYVRALVSGLAQISSPDDDEILLYVDRPLSGDAPLLPPNITVRVLDRRRLRTDLWLFGRQVRLDQPDLVHGTTNCLPPGLPHGIATTVTIHDALQLKRYPFVPVERKLRGRLMGAYEAFLTRQTARRARRVISVSRASADEVCGALRLAPERVRVVHNGILPDGGTDGLKTPASTPAEQRSENVVLALASTDPRKNFEVLLRAFSQGHRAALAGRTVCLRIVCTNAQSAAYVQEAARRHDVRPDVMSLLVRPDDATLRACYVEAAVFVWPSVWEGFGIPPLEAMALGCPVVSSTAPAMPEVLGEAPVWFDPRCPDALAAALGALLGDAARRHELSSRGRAHAARFTCRAMAENTRAVWREATAEA